MDGWKSPSIEYNSKIPTGFKFTIIASFVFVYYKAIVN